MAEAIISTKDKVKDLKTIANRLRKHSLLSTAEAGSGHPTSVMSCAEIMSVLFFDQIRYDFDNPKALNNDRFILSKGHAVPVYWGILVEAGVISEEDNLTLRQIDSDLEGHPTPRNKYVDVATGSLGQGLSVGVGMAIGSKIDGVDSRYYVLLGDGELAEGSVWEAAALASKKQLDNLVGIGDINRLGQSEATMLGHDMNVYKDRFEAFGWNTLVIDGHDIEAIAGAFETAKKTKGKPTMILAETFKGKGVSFLEDKEGKHGKPVTGDELEKALDEVGRDLSLSNSISVKKPESGKTIDQSNVFSGNLAREDFGDTKLATRKAYGSALKKLGDSCEDVVALDAETKNSTYSIEFRDAHPERFVECYIAEQNMVGVALGLSKLGKIPFTSTFGTFYSRAYDQIRMGSVSLANIKFVGSHVGVSIGEDGPSQMGLEDISMFRTLPDSVVLYPSEAVSAEACVELAAKTRGIIYLRTSRPGTPVIYDNNDSFSVGGSKTVKSSDNDQLTVVSAGVTLHEAHAAAKKLESEGVNVRVIDVYCVKPIDKKTLIEAARDTGKILVVEDHYPEGGIGEAVTSALAGQAYEFTHVAVDHLPRSGTPEDLLDHYGLSADRLYEKIKSIV